MQFFHSIFDFIFHTEQVVPHIMQEYGTLFYWILFLVIFCETGLVVTPFLPGDSMIFLVGSLAANELNHLNIWILGASLVTAAVGGNILNYEIGRYLGPRVLKVDRWFLKKKYLDRAQRFYELHGGKAIMLSRFMPILRTFAPFVAGVGRMNRRRFHLFNFFSGAGWVLLFLLLGFSFGQLKIVEHNIKLVTIGIIIISFAPIVIAYYRQKAKNKS